MCQSMLYKLHTVQTMNHFMLYMLYTVHTWCASPCCKNYTLSKQWTISCCTCCTQCTHDVPVHAAQTTHMMYHFMLYILYRVHTWCTIPYCKCTPCPHDITFHAVHDVHSRNMMYQSMLYTLHTLWTSSYCTLSRAPHTCKPPSSSYPLPLPYSGGVKIWNMKILKFNIWQICFIIGSLMAIHLKEMVITSNPYFYAVIILIPSPQWKGTALGRQGVKQKQISSMYNLKHNNAYALQTDYERYTCKRATYSLPNTKHSLPNMAFHMPS